MTDNTLTLDDGRAVIVPPGMSPDAVRAIANQVAVARVAGVGSAVTAGGELASDVAEPTPTFNAPHRGQRIRFNFAGEAFDLPAIMSASKLTQLAQMRSMLPDTATDPDADPSDDRIAQIMDVVGSILAFLIGGKKGQEVKARMLDPDHPDPIDLQTEAVPCMQFLIGRLTGGRPLARSSASPAGISANPAATPTDGTSSTDGASPAG